MKISQLAGVLLSAVLANLWVSPTATAQQPDPVVVTTPDLTPELGVGKMNYDAYCASCHGVNAVGTDKGPTFLHRVYHPGHHSDKAFLVAPRQGARAHHWKFGDMKPVEKVTDAQLETIVKYVRALQKANGIF
jgi:mono/diheme cytochrome c family protein